MKLSVNLSCRLSSGHRDFHLENSIFLIRQISRFLVKFAIKFPRYVIAPLESSGISMRQKTNTLYCNRKIHENIFLLVVKVVKLTTVKAIFRGLEMSYIVNNARVVSLLQIYTLHFDSNEFA